MSLSITKVFHNYPFAHRQPNHDGHCRLIHGHDWTFEIEFQADVLDENHFVVDFGKLKFIRKWLDERFDHTLVLNLDDPHLPHLRDALLHTEGGPFAKIIVVPNCGAEGLSEFILDSLNQLFRDLGIGQDRKLRVSCVRVYEDSKNSATCRTP